MVRSSPRAVQPQGVEPALGEAPARCPSAPAVRSSQAFAGSPRPRTAHVRDRLPQPLVRVRVTTSSGYTASAGGRVGASTIVQLVRMRLTTVSGLGQVRPAGRGPARPGSSPSNAVWRVGAGEADARGVLVGEVGGDAGGATAACSRTSSLAACAMRVPLHPLIKVHDVGVLGPALVGDLRGHAGAVSSYLPDVARHADELGPAARSRRRPPARRAFASTPRCDPRRAEPSCACFWACASNAYLARAGVAIWRRSDELDPRRARAREQPDLHFLASSARATSWKSTGTRVAPSRSRTSCCTSPPES